MSSNGAEEGERDAFVTDDEENGTFHKPGEQPLQELDESVPRCCSRRLFFALAVVLLTILGFITASVNRVVTESKPEPVNDDNLWEDGSSDDAWGDDQNSTDEWNERAALPSPAPPPTQAPVSVEELLKHVDIIADQKAGEQLDKSFSMEQLISLYLNMSHEQAFLTDYAKMTTSIENWKRDCEKERIESRGNEMRTLLWKANCGGDYDLPDPKTSTKPWRIGLLGNWNHGVYEMSGCWIGRHCPLSPNCEFIKLAKQDFLRPDINVLVTPSFDYHLAAKIRKSPETISVLYWREALWNHVPGPATQRNYFHLLMGVHHFASIKNPAFINPPYFLQQQLYAGTLKTQFAASIISDCSTKSHREVYLAQLVKFLGNNRVHRFGRCGNRRFPDRPLENGYRLLARYKFFFSFENTIQTGYSSEKLFQVLALPLIPVYYGDPLAPNVTRTQSYIRTSDFPNPRSLAQYLIYLDQNPTEYAKYHAWRYEENPYETEYLNSVSRVPGPEERLLHAAGGPAWMADRRASCCRLCNEEWLKKLMAERDDKVIVKETFSGARIKRVFYQHHPVSFPTPMPGILESPSETSANVMAEPSAPEDSSNNSISGKQETGDHEDPTNLST